MFDKLKLAIIAAGVLALSAQSAAAQTRWQGFYAGVHAGYEWGRLEVTETPPLLLERVMYAQPGPTVENASVDGIVAGGLAGVNFQNGLFVYGLEADAGLANGHGTGNGAAPPPNLYDLNWTAHLRARAGIASGQAFFFVAGGLAFANLTFTDGDTGARMSSDYTGGSIGAGIDYALSANAVGRIEYLHDDYNVGSGLIAVSDYTADLKTVDTVRVALMLRTP